MNPARAALSFLFSFGIFPVLFAAEPSTIPIAELQRTTPVDFEKEILPVLKNNCLACHNKTKAKADLVLETPQDILKGGESGRGVVPFRSEESLLLAAAAHQKEPLMPPRDNKVNATNLTSMELGLLKLWIDQGALGEVHALTPQHWQSIPEHLRSIYTVAVTSDGNVAACGRANQIFLYDLLAKRLVTKLADDSASSPATEAHRDMVLALAFNPDNSLLASGSYREVKLWRRLKNTQKYAVPFTQERVAADLSQDGQWLATAGAGAAESMIRIWETASGQVAAELPVALREIKMIRFSPDGRQLVVAGSDPSLHLLSRQQGTPAFKADIGSAPAALAWNADGRLLMTASGKKIRIWSVAVSNENVLSLEKEMDAHDDEVIGLASVSTNFLLSASRDGLVRHWNLESAKLLREFKHGSPIHSLAVAPKGKRLASVADNGRVKLWNLESGALIAELKGDRYAYDLVAEKERQHSFAQSEIGFWKKTAGTAENQQRIQIERVMKATGTNEATEKIFAEKQKAAADAKTAHDAGEKTVASLKEELEKANDSLKKSQKELESAKLGVKQAAEKGGALDQALDEAMAKAVAVGENKIKQERLIAETQEKLKTATQKLPELKKADDESQKQLAAAQAAKAKTDHELNLAIQSAAKAAESAADAQNSGQQAAEEEKKVELELAAAKKAAANSERPARALVLSDALLAVATDDGQIRTWNSETGIALESLKTSRPGIAWIGFRGGAELLMVALGASGQIVNWDLAPRWVLERTLAGTELAPAFIDRVNVLKFSADGRTLATGGGEPTRGGEIKLWEVATGNLLQEFKNVHSDAVLGLDFSPDRKCLATAAADRFVKIIELATGRIVRSFEGHTHHVLGVSWKRDGRTLATAGADNVVKIWDFVSGERKKNIDGFGKEVTSINYISYSDQALASSGDSQVRSVRETGEKVRSFDGATDFMHAAAVTPDGKIIVAGGEDGVLRIWNGTDGAALATFAWP